MSTSIYLLARDPNWLYACWEIDEDSKAGFASELGKELWEKSVPALKITNISKNTSFFVRINDFSDNWFINVPDAGCTYMAEIGRLASGRYFISMASSNCADTPGNGISANRTAYFICYKDLVNNRSDSGIDKTNEIDDIFEFSKEDAITGISSAELPGSSGTYESGIEKG